MKLLQITILITLISLVVKPNYAQKEWTLDDCIIYAIENNIQIKRQGLTSESAKNTYTQSYLEVLPGIQAGGSGYYNTGKTLNTETYTYVEDGFKGGNVYTGANMTVFNGLQQFNRIQREKLNLSAQLENEKRAKNDVTINVSMAFMQILLDSELLKIAEEQLSVTLSQIEKTKRLYEIGNVPRQDLLAIETQAANEKLQLINAQNSVDIAYLNLTQLLNLESAEGFEIHIPDNIDISVASVLPEVNTTYNDVVQILPQIKAAEYMNKSAQKDVNIAWGTLSPSITFDAQWGSRFNELNRSIIGETPAVIPTDYQLQDGTVVYWDGNVPTYADEYPYIDQVSDNSSTYVGFNITIPIFNRYRRITQISNAKIAKKTAQYNLDEAKQILFQEIQQATQQSLAALERYNANNEAVESMQEAFNYTEQRYNIGMVDVVEYNVAKNNLTSAKANALQAKYEYIFRTKILNFYRGEQIKL